METHSYSDYFARMRAILARMLGRLLGLKEQGGQEEEIRAEVNDMTKEYLGIELSVLAEMSKEEFLACLADRMKQNADPTVVLADVLKVHAEVVEQTDEVYSKKIYEKLQLLYQYAISVDKNYNLGVHQKLKEATEKMKP